MKYDYIVLGAGSAGSIVASRLSENPDISVLLIESGRDYPDFEQLPDEVKFGFATGTDIMTSDHNWQFTGKATDSAPPMLVPRGKVTGGSSAINGQIFLRGVPEDYDSWADKGNSEWRFQDCLQYLRMIENDQEYGSGDFHNSEGSIIVRRYKPSELLSEQSAFYTACQSEGFSVSPDHNAPDASGVGPCPVNNPNGIRWSTALGYLNPARHRLNLTIRANCTVQRLIIEGNEVVGVEVESGGEQFIAEAQEFILSSGAIGSPQILMLSGVGPAEHLTSLGISVVVDLPGVGQNLRDHPMAFTTYRTKPDHPMDGLAPRMQMALRYTADGSNFRNDMQLLMQSFATERVDRGGERMLPLGVRILAILNLAESSGELKLGSSNPADPPILDYGYLKTEFDRKRMRDAVRLSCRIFENDEFKDIVDERIEPTEQELASDAALDEYIARDVTTGHHISGTCKMGPDSDPNAVVDQYGKVHGLDRIRIADASIMPDVIRANTNVTTMMIGERIANFILNGK